MSVQGKSQAQAGSQNAVNDGPQSNERSHLLARSSSPGYSAVPSGEEVEVRLGEKKHFNLAGLTPRSFWILVNDCYQWMTWSAS